MGISRRTFLKTAGGAGVAAAAATLGGCTGTTKTNKPGQGPRYGMVIDLRRCFGCHACSVACKAEQDVPLGYFKSWVVVSEKGRYPKAGRDFVPVLCNHCDKPPCVEACPTQATDQRGPSPKTCSTGDTEWSIWPHESTGARGLMRARALAGEATLAVSAGYLATSMPSSR